MNLTKTFKPVQATTEWEAWLSPAGLTMDEAEAKLIALGNTILRRDDEGNRFLCMNQKEDPEMVWKCNLCPAFSRDYDVALAHEETHNA